MKAIPYLLLTLVLFTASPAHAQKDATGCKDSPLLTRYPGSIISSCTDKTDDAFDFTMSQAGKIPPRRIEGEFHQTTYNYPSTAGKAAVVRNLNTALHRAGYTFDYDSGDYGDFTAHMGKTWILIEVSRSGNYRQTIVTATALTQDVVANAAALSSGLSTTGHAVVNGILFETGKSDVKPESSAALQEVANLLKQDPALKVYVVGHTDNVGALAANLDLSRLRAAAVVAVLTTQYAIPADRLAPFGAGPYAPLASNEFEDGRSANRRVEIVKQ
jgi:OOP family OmpA-OmpF porin